MLPLKGSQRALLAVYVYNYSVSRSICQAYEKKFVYYVQPGERIFVQVAVNCTGFRVLCRSVHPEITPNYLSMYWKKACPQAVNFFFRSPSDLDPHKVVLRTQFFSP